MGTCLNGRRGWVLTFRKKSLWVWDFSLCNCTDLMYAWTDCNKGKLEITLYDPFKSNSLSASLFSGYCSNTSLLFSFIQYLCFYKAYRCKSHLKGCQLCIIKGFIPISVSAGRLRVWHVLAIATAEQRMLFSREWHDASIARLSEMAFPPVHAYVCLLFLFFS